MKQNIMLTPFKTVMCFIAKYFFVLSIIILLWSCGGNDVKVAVYPSLKERKIEKINFFMETSGSMAGYLKGSTDFSKTIPNLLVAIEDKTDSFHKKMPLHNYFISDSAIAFTGQTSEFITALATQKVPRDKSSEMDKIFKLIAAKTDSNDISIFVSDCILSYSDKEIKTNPEINRDKAEAGLKPIITSTFHDLQGKNNVCASVYGFNSSFFGTYYTYQNGKLQLNGDVLRPYYIWVIGNKDLLKKFNGQLKKMDEFKPDNVALDFGIFDKPVTDYGVFFSYKNTGTWTLENKALTGMDVSKNNTATVAIGLDLSSLPYYAKDTNYLTKNLKLGKEDVDYRILNILLPEKIDKEKLRKNELEVFAKSTHIILLEISNVFKTKSNINITLPLQYDTSYRSISIMDDRKIGDIAGKTFAFQYLVDGVRAAYQNPNEDFINISIPIKKQ